MTPERIAELAELLDRAESAHGAYETTELHGAYDKAWADWYAMWAVDHGIGRLIGRPIAADELSRFLTRSTAELDELRSRPAQTWAAWTAGRIAADLGA